MTSGSGPAAASPAAARDPAAPQPDFVALDFETADRQGKVPIAVAAVAVHGGRLTPLISLLIRPVRPTRILLQAIHRIDEQMLAGAPTPDVVIPELIRHLASAPFIVCHNAPFDRRALRHAAACAGACPPQLHFRCTLRMARDRWPGLPADLRSVTRRLGIEYHSPHNPLADATAAAEVYLALDAADGAEPYDA